METCAQPILWSTREQADGPLDMGWGVLPKASCACKGAKRPCYFIHGLGVQQEQGLVDTFAYFGKIKDHAPCCSSVRYTVLNTVDNEWYQDTLQQKVCDLALQVSPTSNAATKVIADTIIVTHSMGNLMVAGALATQKCSFAPSVDWVGMSGPMKGSMACDFVRESCGNGGPVGFLAGLLGQCPANISIRAMVYEKGTKASALLKEKYAAAQAAYAKFISAVMCSNGPSGLSGGDQLVYRTASSLIPHKSKENDGMVRY
jgi:hypothetical protein